MSRDRELALVGAILCAYFVLFGRGVAYEFVWDDVGEIQNASLFDRPLLEGLTTTQTERTDPTLTDAVGLRLAYDSYRPLLFASYWFDIRLWGRSAFALHLTNLVLGALAIACMFAVTRHWLGSCKGTIAATAIFALHPLQIEAVVYISGRGDLLAGLFALCATLCVLRALDARVVRWSILGALAFFASLLSKESCIGLPLAIAGIMWMEGKLRRRWWIVVLLVSVALAYLGLRRMIVVPTTSSALLEGVVALPGVGLEYARLLLFPFDLSTERLHDVRYVWPGWAFAVLTVAALGFARWRGCALSRSAAAGALWFGALLGPSAVAIAASTGVVSDRYTYSAVAGGAIALTAFGGSVVRCQPRLYRPLALLAAVWALMTVAMCWIHVPVWRDNHTLYTHAVAMTPESSEAHYRLAYLAARNNDWEQAIPLLERAITLDPQNVRALVNLGVGKLRTGQPEEAEAAFQHAVEANPAAFRAWFNLGIARLALGKQAQACDAIARAVAINPRYTPATISHRENCWKR